MVRIVSDTSTLYSTTQGGPGCVAVQYIHE